MNPYAPRKILFRLLKELFPYWTTLLFGFVFYLVFGVSNAYLAEIFKMIVDQVQGIPHHYLIEIPWGVSAAMYISGSMILVAIFRSLGNLGGAYCMGYLSANVVHHMRENIQKKNLGLPQPTYDNLSQGEMLSRISYTSQQISYSIGDALVYIVRESLTLLALLAYLAYLSPTLTLAFLVITPPLALVFSKSSRVFRKVGRQIQEAMAKVTHIASEGIRGFQLVKVYQAQESELERFSKVSSLLASSQKKAVFSQGLASSLVGLILAFCISGLLYLVVQKGWGDSVSPGELVAYLTAIGLLSRPIRQLSELNRIFQQTIAAATDIFKFLDLKEEELPKEDEKTFQDKTPFLEVKNISMHYNQEQNRLILDDLSFTLPYGKTLAIVGRSGAGKSSLVKVLLKLYPVQKGEIWVGGANASELSLERYRSLFSFVPQKSVIFNETLKRNIAYNVPLDRIDEKKLQRVMKEAHVLEFSSELPQGEETILGDEGLLLSGGQAQRVSIARALYRDAPILVLDEATSSLDSESESLIQDALLKVRNQKTCIMIAHRLSTIRMADEILVLEKGRLVQRGSHEQLIASEGIYKTLSSHQGFH